MLSSDWTALDAVVRSVQHWIDDHPPAAGFQPGEGDLAIPAVGLPNALLAAWRYGEYLDFALDESESEEEAELRKFFWDHTVGLVRHVPRLASVILAQVEHLGAVALRMDGTWDAGRFPYWVATITPEDLGVDPLGAKNPIDVEAVTAQAWTAFDRAAGVLGQPVAPESPPVDLWEPTRERIERLFGD